MTNESSRTRIMFACWLVCAALAGCGKRPAENTDAPGPDVTVTTVRKAALDQELRVSGNLAALPNRDAKVGALVPGRIRAVLVSEGDRVSAGQALAELDGTSLEDQRRQAEAAVAQAKATLENAKLSAQRNEDLLQRGIAARKDVEDARTQVSVDSAALNQAEAALSVARTQTGRAVIRSPFAGTVVHRFLGVGEQVDGGGSQPIIEVANIDTLELPATAPAPRLPEIRDRAEFNVHIDAFPASTFKARITAILPAVDPATNNGTVRIGIGNPEHLLKLGMFVTVELPLRANLERMIVPRQAIYPDESGEPHAYKISGDRAESVAVQLGVQTKDEVEIVSGLAEGDTIILAGGYGLPEKSKVHITK